MPKDQQKHVTSRQRPVSCQFCQTRKLRCSRTAPCSNCVSRGITCNFEHPIAQPSSAPKTSDNSEIIKRLHRLENLLVTQNGEEQRQSSQPSDVAEPRPQLVHPLSSPPQIQNVDVDSEGSIYVEQMSSQDQIKSSRVILLLSVFVAATYSWVQSDCAYGLFSNSSEANDQTLLWIKAAEDVLDIAYRSPNVSIEGVQGVIIIGFVAANLDGLHRYRVLFAMGVVRARDLGLHRIDHPSIAGMANTAEAEMGRRVWWYLCTSDWVMAARVGGMAEGVYSCHPRQMITKKPLNINGEEVLDGMSRDERPLFQPTTMSYTMQSIRLAEISRSIVDRNPLAMAHTSGLTHDAVMDIDTELQTLINDLPAFYSMSKSSLIEMYGLTQSQAENSDFQGLITYFLLYSQRCKLHLSYFALSLEDLAYSSSREICIKYSRLIIQSELWQENSDIDTATRFKFNGLLIGVFMACIVLLMDICVNPLSPQYEKQRQEVYKSFKIIEEAKNESKTTAKSVDSLIHILRKYNVPPLNAVPNQQQSEVIPRIETALDTCEASRHSENGEVAFSGASNSQYRISDDFDLIMTAESPLNEGGDDLSSYWNDFTQSFEQGIDVNSFDWDNIFLELDSSFI